MRKFFVRFCMLFLLLLLLPAVILTESRQESPETPSGPSADGGHLTSGAVLPEYYRVWETGSDRILKVTPLEYLKGTAAAELPASFQTETLIAQMVASHSYALTVMAADPDHTVSDDPGRHQGYLTEAERKELYGSGYAQQEQRLEKAAEEALCWLLTSDGKNLLPAVFHSCSSGRTESAENIWGSAVPCLDGVESPGDPEAPCYRQELSFSPQQAQQLIHEQLPDCDLAAGGITVKEVSPSKTVLTAELGGIPCTGQQLRQIFSLPSACFTVTSDEGGITFTTLGRGHGVGMSQYGAESMALSGSSWQDILAHYYPGSVLLKISLQEDGI